MWLIQIGSFISYTFPDLVGIAWALPLECELNTNSLVQAARTRRSLLLKTTAYDKMGLIEPLQYAGEGTLF